MCWEHCLQTPATIRGMRLVMRAHPMVLLDKIHMPLESGTVVFDEQPSKRERG